MLPQLAIAEFLGGGGFDHCLRQARKAYRHQTTMMAQAIGHYFPEGTKVSRPSGGFVLWVEMPPSVDGTAVYEAALAQGATITPGALFSAQSKYRNCIRLNAAVWTPTVERAIERIGKIIAQMI
jgi:DNA-binding transcriptional MocR family regulator